MQSPQLGDPNLYRRIHLMWARPRPMRPIPQALDPAGQPKQL
jgi:hypothetical protein